MSTTTSPRRFYLRKRQAAVALCDDNASVWQGKQEAEPGTSLPSTFPFRSRLLTAGYTAEEDLDGATEAELVAQRFTAREAQRVLSAFTALP